MIAGLDGTELGAVSAIAVAVIGAIGLIVKSRTEAQSSAQKDTIKGCIALINELQQERDTDRKNSLQQRSELQRSIARCDRRVSDLQGRMSKLVTYVRTIEGFLRKHHLIDQAPKFDWSDFYRPEA